MLSARRLFGAFSTSHEVKKPNAPAETKSRGLVTHPSALLMTHAVIRGRSIAVHGGDGLLFGPDCKREIISLIGDGDPAG